MFKMEIQKYKKLNEIGDFFGTVILGSGEDIQIPVSELADSFKINTKFYNRSAQHLSITEAVNYYDSVVKALHPERVILHIGSSDIEFFKDNAQLFDNEYRSLIEHIRKDNKNCNIGIISLLNSDSNKVVKELNHHLRIIAESLCCEFEDISTPRVWSPMETKNAMSFASAMGLPKKANDQKSMYDLAKIFFS